MNLNILNKRIILFYIGTIIKLSKVKICYLIFELKSILLEIYI